MCGRLQQEEASKLWVGVMRWTRGVPGYIRVGKEAGRKRAGRHGEMKRSLPTQQAQPHTQGGASKHIVERDAGVAES